MNTPEIPDRHGWVTGELAKLPPCPPFPAFTVFERHALESLAPLFAPHEGMYRAQIDVARVVDRINTKVGFYTRIAVDRKSCQPLALRLKGGQFEVDGVVHGMGVVLWDDDSYLDTIEGYTHLGSQLEGLDLADLKFGKLVKLNSSVN